jgi:putative transposase
MPNHFHLLLKQKQEEGIVRFMANSINSVTRFYNILSERKGPVFFTQFRSRRIITREQFMHVSRYIHLNPYSSGIVKTYEELMQYPLSSLRYYIQPDNQSICNTKLVLDEFSNNTQSYKDFVIDNAEYQKTLDHIKHIDKWI